MPEDSIDDPNVANLTETKAQRAPTAGLPPEAPRGLPFDERKNRSIAARLAGVGLIIGGVICWRAVSRGRRHGA